MEKYAEITELDVGKYMFQAFGRVWRVSGHWGRTMQCDVGKRVYLVNDSLQIESSDQLAKRLRTAKPA